MTRTLDDLMSFDHVIQVHPDGIITEPKDVYGPEGIEMETLDDDAGSIMESHEIAYAAEAERQGWQLMRGYSGQYAVKSSNYIMHTSEYIGGRMEQDSARRRVSMSPLRSNATTGRRRDGQLPTGMSPDMILTYYNGAAYEKMRRVIYVYQGTYSGAGFKPVRYRKNISVRGYRKPYDPKG